MSGSHQTVHIEINSRQFPELARLAGCASIKELGVERNRSSVREGGRMGSGASSGMAAPISGPRPGESDIVCTQRTPSTD